MSIKDLIFGAPKLVDNIFDKDKGLLTQVGQWVGHQQFTDEEQAIHSAAMGESIRGFAVATMGENTDRSKARRTIAVEWFKLQIWLIKLNVLCVFLDYLIKELNGSEAGFTASIGAVAFSPYMWGITGAVSVFFFGSHALRSSKWGKE